MLKKERMLKEGKMLKKENMRILTKSGVPFTSPSVPVHVPIDPLPQILLGCSLERATSEPNSSSEYSEFSGWVPGNCPWDKLPQLKLLHPTACKLY